MTKYKTIAGTIINIGNIKTPSSLDMYLPPLTFMLIFFFQTALFSFPVPLRLQLHGGLANFKRCKHKKS